MNAKIDIPFYDNRSRGIAVVDRVHTCIGDQLVFVCRLKSSNHSYFKTSIFQSGFNNQTNSVKAYLESRNNLKMPSITPDILAKLQNQQKTIRNICVLAHVDHGRSLMIVERKRFCLVLSQHFLLP
jgi:hypothetical protein